jgi:hypothetical protein
MIRVLLVAAVLLAVAVQSGKSLRTVSRTQSFVRSQAQRLRLIELEGSTNPSVVAKETSISSSSRKRAESDASLSFEPVRSMYAFRLPLSRP